MAIQLDDVDELWPGSGRNNRMLCVRGGVQRYVGSSIDPRIGLSVNASGKYNCSKSPSCCFLV